jgi:hypothetical protein
VPNRVIGQLQRRILIYYRFRTIAGSSTIALALQGSVTHRICRPLEALSSDKEELEA